MQTLLDDLLDHFTHVLHAEHGDNFVHYRGRWWVRIPGPSDSPQATYWTQDGARDLLVVAIREAATRIVRNLANDRLIQSLRGTYGINQVTGRASLVFGNALGLPANPSTPVREQAIAELWAGSQLTKGPEPFKLTWKLDPVPEPPTPTAGN